jgi:AcrR family transcriptional regulator
MATAWFREEQPELAAEKILDAAEKAFVELGVSAAGMAKIAEFAGCSRGTLYRYFKNRHDLHLAYINRAALATVARVHAGIAGIEDPRERLVEGILRSVREVRRNPGTAAWFELGVSGMAARMSRSSEVIETLTMAFVSELLGPGKADPESRLGALWLVRVIVSLLVMPGASGAEERALVERYVAPALTAACYPLRTPKRLR